MCKTNRQPDDSASSCRTGDTEKKGVCPRKPNVLFIMTDQQRWDCVGANRNPIIRTPNLDALAADGVNFSNSFTNAIACVPSRAGLMSGQYVHTHGVRDTGGTRWLHPETPTLPGCFSAQGYHTVGVGKMHFKPWYVLGGFDRRVICDGQYDPSQGEDEYRVVLREKGLLDKGIGHHTPHFGKEYKSIPTTELPPEYYMDNYIGRRGVQTLNKIAISHQPFFLAVSFVGPHDPYDPPPPYCQMYDHAQMPTGYAREGELDILPEHVLKGVTDMGKEHLNLTAVPEAKKREITAHYYGNITLIDDWVGKLMDTLKQRGLYDDTIIVFTSDHGEYLGDHNLYYKGYFPCDSDCKVPLILKAPGLPTGLCDALTGNVDVMPTLLDCAGLATPDTVQGRSLLPVIRNEAAGDEAIATYSERGPARRLRTREWAWVSRDGEGHEQLYYLPDDPHELNNLADAKPQIIKKLQMLQHDPGGEKNG